MGWVKKLWCLCHSFHLHPGSFLVLFNSNRLTFLDGKRSLISKYIKKLIDKKLETPTQMDSLERKLQEKKDKHDKIEETLI